MGRGNRYTLVAIVGVIAAVLVIVFTIRSLAGGIAGIGRGGDKVAGDFIEETLRLEQVEELEVDGIWDVQVFPAAGDPRVELEAPPEYIDYIRDNSDQTLELTGPRGFRHLRETPRAMVYSDIVSSVQISGAAQIEFGNLELGDLSLEIEGASNITSASLLVSNLELSAEGASNVDFSRATITNANIDIEGASSVLLNMNGGELSGSLRGMGQVKYSGEVSNQDFSIDGLGSIEYLD